MHPGEVFKKIYKEDPGSTQNHSLLKESIKEYPYFGLSYFFLLKESRPENDIYQKTAPKALMHFGNSYLLQLRLAEKYKTEPNNEKTPLVQQQTQDEFLFEPLHTTDYFASVGIKLSEEKISGDKLGRQMKSFTEWLKTMKKIHGNQIPENGNPLDNKVEQLAENSNIESDVITESMAQVYEQQGKFSKAIDIYKKLSLQNPSKSDYFAKQINRLKEN